jgi:hypothetical protein
VRLREDVAKQKTKTIRHPSRVPERAR